MTTTTNSLSNLSSNFAAPKPPAPAVSEASAQVVSVVQDGFSQTSPADSSLSPVIAPVLPVAVSPQARASAIAAARGLTKTTLSFSAAAIREQSDFAGNEVSFEKALEKALESFLTDDEDIESPLSLVTEEGADPAELLSWMNRASSTLGLVGGDERVDGESWYPAEHGESVDDNWIFFLRMDDFSDHLFWAIVPRDGGPVENYGFN